MKEYRNRTYRHAFRGDRWLGFVVKHKETDIWVGVNPDSYVPEMQDCVRQTLTSLRREVDLYIDKSPFFARTLRPYQPESTAPSVVKRMAEAAARADVGPMAAVAGAFAEHVALCLKAEFGVGEVMVENGGDIYADVKAPIDVSVFAGESPLSGRVGMCIPAEETPLGICTSSGTVGPSLSFGRADAVMIVSKDPLLADAFATSYGNRIHTPADFEPVIRDIQQQESILSALIVKDEEMAIVGKFELRLFTD